MAGKRELIEPNKGDKRFVRRDDFQAHEARVCIHEGMLLDDPKRPRRYTEEQYLKSPAEMAALFADLPEALENSVEIARRCSLPLAKDGYHLPAFAVPDGTDAKAWLARLPGFAPLALLQLLLYIEQQAFELAQVVVRQVCPCHLCSSVVVVLTRA